MKGILGRKIGMTQVFATSGEAIPVTVIEVTPNVVLRVKTLEKDGYNAVQLGACEKRESLFNKPDLGQFVAAKTTPKRFIREIRDMDGVDVGQEVAADVFSVGEVVSITAISKGKGFAGPMKRHNQSRGPKSHGSHYHRAVGSLGATGPGRVAKGQKMPGHMGHEQVTTMSSEIIKIDVAKHAILVKGPVPGPKKQLVIIKTNNRSVKNRPASQLVNLYSNQTPVKEG